MVWQAVAVYGFKKKVLKSSEDWSTRVDYIVQRLLDSDNAICWGVDCAHVARYMDKSFGQYFKESSQSYKVLHHLVQVLIHGDEAQRLEAMNDAIRYLESHEKAWPVNEEITRPGDAPRALRNHDGEEGTLP